MESTKIKLASGAEMEIQIAPFPVAKALYQAVLTELQRVKVSLNGDAEDLLKNLFCVAFSSREIEDCIWACFERVLINKVRVNKNTFEPVEMRGDYIQACMEVAKINILPFGKSLFAEFSTFRGMIEENPA